MKRRVRRKKTLNSEESVDAALGYEAELRREMCVIDRQTKEITSRFEQVHTLSTKHDFLLLLNLLNENFDCQLDAMLAKMYTFIFF